RAHRPRRVSRPSGLPLPPARGEPDARSAETPARDGRGLATVARPSSRSTGAARLGVGPASRAGAPPPHRLAPLDGGVARGPSRRAGRGRSGARAGAGAGGARQAAPTGSPMTRAQTRSYGSNSFLYSSRAKRSVMPAM